MDLVESYTLNDKAQPKDKTHLNFPVIAIALSIGGFEALKKIFDTDVFNSLKASFIITAHYDYSNENSLVELISAYSGMKTILIKHLMPIKPNKIYVCPPKHTVSINRGKFKVVASNQTDFESLAINCLFNSLATTIGTNLIAIVLSGIQGFGISSLLQIKRNGGVIIVQDPDSTEYNAMPLSAIEAEAGDHIVAPEAMPNLLLSLTQQKRSMFNNAQKALEDKPLKTPAFDQKLFDLINRINSDQLERELENLRFKKIQLELENLKKQHTNLNDYVNRVEFKMRDVERLRLIEQLTTMILHDLCQPLGIISNYANGCIRRLEKDNFKKEDLTYALTQILNATHQADTAYQRVKNFKCTNNLFFQPVAIHNLIKEVITLMQDELANFNISLNYRPTLHLPELQLDVIHIEKVILYIMRNAVEAMKSDNTTAPKIIIETELKQSNIVINIMDNGPGFAPGIANILFDSNFTTKPQPAGFGLSISRTILESHGGSISAISLPHGGSCFKIMLPIDKE